MLLNIILACFNVPDASFEGGKSGEGGSVVADGTELAN